MVTTEQEMVEYIVSLIEANITDPLTGRAAKGKKWVYDDIPRDDLSDYPRIAVYPVVSNYQEYAGNWTTNL